MGHCWGPEAAWPPTCHSPNLAPSAAWMPGPPLSRMARPSVQLLEPRFPARVTSTQLRQPVHCQWGRKLVHLHVLAIMKKQYGDSSENYKENYHMIQQALFSYLPK